jgi:hypothetical protein
VSDCILILENICLSTTTTLTDRQPIHYTDIKFKIQYFPRGELSHSSRNDVSYDTVLSLITKEAKSK